MKIIEIIKMFENVKEIGAIRSEIEEQRFNGNELSEQGLKNYGGKLLKCKNTIFNILSENTELKVEEIEKIVKSL